VFDKNGLTRVKVIHGCFRKQTENKKITKERTDIFIIEQVTFFIDIQILGIWSKELPVS
jgi:hypothetical protein